MVRSRSKVTSSVCLPSEPCALRYPLLHPLLQNIESPPGAVLDLLDLTVDRNHGKCNVVFVGIIPTAEQKKELQDYSRKFKVWPVLLKG